MPRIIRVAVTGMNDRTRYLLEKFFSGFCHGKYILSDPQDADIGIIDIDGMGAMDQAQKFEKSYPGMPLIVESLNDPHIEGAIFVKKPIRFAQLISALANAESNMELKQVLSLTQPNTKSLFTPAPISDSECFKSGAAMFQKNQRIPVLDQKVHRKAAEAAFAHSASLDVSYKKEIRQAEQSTEGLLYFKGRNNHSTGALSYYRLDLYYQSFIQKAYKASKDKCISICLRVLNDLFVVFTADGDVQLFGASAADYATLLSRSVDAQQPQKMEFPPTSLGRPAVQMDATSFVWEITLKTSKGRIPYGVDLQRSFSLKQWPNLTRVAPIPHAAQISALWTTKPVSLQATPTLLGIKKEVVYAFYSCVSACELINFSDAAVVSVARMRQVIPKNLWQRLLNRFKWAEERGT